MSLNAKLHVLFTDGTDHWYPVDKDCIQEVVDNKIQFGCHVQDSEGNQWIMPPSQIKKIELIGV